jgi:lincosamide nucleotidyltransferase A/C/D/E
MDDGFVRRRVLPVARRVYARLEAGPLRRALEVAPVQRLRRRWQRGIALDDLLEIAAVLDAAGGRWWLAGGWGVDALAGRQTRPHGDLDLVLDRSAMDAARAALAAHGFALRRPSADGTYHHVPGSLMPDREEVQDRAGRTVDLHPVDAATWLRGTTVAEPYATGSLGGRSVPCLSADAQRVVRVHYTPGEKDLADLRSLDRLAPRLDQP